MEVSGLQSVYLVESDYGLKQPNVHDRERERAEAADGPTVALGAEGGEDVIVLHEVSGERPSRATAGLCHVALRHASRLRPSTATQSAST